MLVVGVQEQLFQKKEDVSGTHRWPDFPLSPQLTCLSPTLPCGEGKAAPPAAGCMCSALQVEVTHLRALVLQCLDEQKQLQQETVRLSAKLQRFCPGTEGMQQVRTTLGSLCLCVDCGGCAEGSSS